MFQRNNHNLSVYRNLSIDEKEKKHKLYEEIILK